MLQSSPHVAWAAGAASFVAEAPFAAGAEPTGDVEPQSGSANEDDDVTAACARALKSFVFIGGGSGVLISADGYVLSNFHVAGTSTKWAVQTSDGKSRIAELIGVEPFGDLALLKIMDAAGLPFAELGDSDALRIGQAVVAVGNPFVLGSLDKNPTVTLGIISAIHTFQDEYSDAIQTDARINPGNSGGPLFTLDGKLVGINGKIATRFGTRHNTGIGYAIPSNQIARFLPGLKEGGVVPRATILGLQFDSHQQPGAGVRLAGVDPDTTALKICLEQGDVIESISGTQTPSLPRFFGVLWGFPGGVEAELGVVSSNGERRSIKLTLDKREIPKELTYMFDTWVGLELYTPRDREGAGVRGVSSKGPAEAAGIKDGDIILAFDGTKVVSHKQFIELKNKKRPGTQVKIELEREGKKVEVVLTLQRRRR
ncbi:MAG: trypsin-like peptidase domain-containing protein [Planctomycetota bacterium]|nr:trypsin-like peptidase domain-containing protein [Planctomycetota bacterium]